MGFLNHMIVSFMFHEQARLEHVHVHTYMPAVVWTLKLLYNF